MQACLPSFDTLEYFNHRFPVPQYLGAKYVHRKWIAQFVPDDSMQILDAFSGSQSVAYMFKQMGKKVVTNDLLKFNYIIGKSIVENPDVKLVKNDVDILFSENDDPENFNLMEKLYAGLFFPLEDARFSDSFRSNVHKLGNPYKEALALAVMCRSMTRKVTMGHFAHTRAMAYAADPIRVKRNRSLAEPLRNIFLDLLDEYNAAIFDNGKGNISYNENIITLLPKISDIDLVYFDPPYCNSHADYQSFYHLPETFIEYWKDKKFINRTKRYYPKKYSGFDTRQEALKNFNVMFKMALKIPVWLISYNDRSFPDIKTFIDILRRYRHVMMERKTYNLSRGGKGSVAGSSEILFICT